MKDIQVLIIVTMPASCRPEPHLLLTEDSKKDIFRTPRERKRMGAQRPQVYRETRKVLHLHIFQTRLLRIHSLGRWPLSSHKSNLAKQRSN